MYVDGGGGYGKIGGRARGGRVRWYTRANALRGGKDLSADEAAQLPDPLSSVRVLMQFA